MAIVYLFGSVLVTAAENNGRGNGEHQFEQQVDGEASFYRPIIASKRCQPSAKSR